MSEPSALGTIAFFTGRVSARNAAGEQRQLSSGDPVYADDLIITDEFSTVAIDFADGSRRGLASRSRIRLDPVAIERGEFAPESLPEAEPAAADETAEQQAATASDLQQGADSGAARVEELQAAIDRMGGELAGDADSEDAGALADSIVAGLEFGDGETSDALDPELLQSVVQGLLGDSGMAAGNRELSVDDIRRALSGILEGLPKEANGLPGVETLRPAILGVLGGGLPTGRGGRLERSAIARAMHGMLLAVCDEGAGQPGGDVLSLLIRGLIGELPAGRSGVPDAATLENCAAGVLDGLQAFQGVLQLRAPQIVGIASGLLHDRLDRDAETGISAKGMTTALKGLAGAFRRDREHCHADILEILAHTVQGGNLALEADGLPDPEQVAQALSAHVAALGKAQVRDGGEYLDALVRAVLRDVPLFDEQGLPNGRVVAAALRGCLQALTSRGTGALPPTELFESLLNAMLLGQIRRPGEALPARAAIAAAMVGILQGLESPDLLLSDPARFEAAVQSLLGGSLPAAEGVPDAEQVRDALGGVLGGLEQAGVLDRDNARWAIQGVLRGSAGDGGPCGLPSLAYCRSVLQGLAVALAESGLYAQGDDGYLDDDGLQAMLVAVTRGGVLERGLTPDHTECAAAIDLLNDALASSELSMAPLRVRAASLAGLYSGGFETPERSLDDGRLQAVMAGVLATLPTAAPAGGRELQAEAMFAALLGARLQAAAGAVPVEEIGATFAALAGALDEAGLNVDDDAPLLAGIVRGLVGSPRGIDAEGSQQVLGAMLDGVQGGSRAKPGRGMLVGLLQGVWAGRAEGTELGEALRGAIALLSAKGELEAPDPFTLNVLVEGILGRLPRAADAQVPEAEQIRSAIAGLIGGLPPAMLSKDGLPKSDYLVALAEGVIGGQLPRTSNGIYASDALATVLEGLFKGLPPEDGIAGPAEVSRIVSALLGDRIPVDANGMFGADSIAPVTRGVLQGLRQAGATLDGSMLRHAVEGVLAGGIEVGETGAPGQEAIELAFQGVVAGVGDREQAGLHLAELAGGTLAGGLALGEELEPAPLALSAALKGLLAGFGIAAAELPPPETLETLIRAVLGGGLLAHGREQAPGEQAVSVSVQGVLAALPVDSVDGLAPIYLRHIMQGILGTGGERGGLFDAAAVAEVTQGATVGFTGRSNRLLDAARQEQLLRGVLGGGIDVGDDAALAQLSAATAGAFALADWNSHEPDDGDLVREYLIRGVTGGGLCGEDQQIPPSAQITAMTRAVIAGVAGDALPAARTLEPVVRGLFGGGLRAGISGYDESALTTSVEAVLAGLPAGAGEEAAILQAVVSGLLGSKPPQDAAGQLSVGGFSQALRCVLKGAGAALGGEPEPWQLQALVRGVLAGGVALRGNGQPDGAALSNAVRGTLVVLEDDSVTLSIEEGLPAAIQGALAGGLPETAAGVPAADAIAASLRAVIAGTAGDEQGWPPAGLLQAAIRGVCGGRLPRLANDAPAGRALTQLLSGVLGGLPGGGETVPAPARLAVVCEAVLGEGLTADAQGCIEREHLATVMEAFVSALPASALRVLGKRALPEAATTRAIVTGILASAGVAGEPSAMDTLVSNARGVIGGLPVLPKTGPGPESLQALLSGVFDGSLPLTPVAVVSGDGLATGLQAGLQVWQAERNEWGSGVWLQALVRAALSPGLRIVQDMMPSPSAKIIGESLAGLRRGYKAATGEEPDPLTMQVIIEAMLDGGVRAEMGHEVIRNSVAGVLAGLDEDGLPEPRLLQRMIQGVLGGGLIAQGVSEPEVLEQVINAVLAGLPLDEPVPPPAALQAVVAGVLGKAPSSAGGLLDAATITRVLQGVLKGLKVAGSRHTSPEAIQRALVAALSRMPAGNPPRDIVQLVVSAVVRKLPPRGAGLSGPQAVEQLFEGLLRPFSGRAVAGEHLPLVDALVGTVLQRLPVCEHGVASGSQAARLIQAALQAGLLREQRTQPMTDALVEGLLELMQNGLLADDEALFAFAAELAPVLDDVDDERDLSRRLELALAILKEADGDAGRLRPALLAAVSCEEAADSGVATVAGHTVKSLRAVEAEGLEPLPELLRPLLTARLGRSKSRQSLAGKTLEMLAAAGTLTAENIAATLATLIALDGRLVDSKQVVPVLADVMELLASDDVAPEELPPAASGMLLAWSGAGRRVEHGAGSGSGRVLDRAVIGGLHDAGVTLNCADIATGLETAIGLRDEWQDKLPANRDFDALLRQVLRERGGQLPGSVEGQALVAGFEALVTRLEAEARDAAEQASREQAEREAREQAERDAREQAERAAREEAEQLAREAAERQAREEAAQAEREAADEPAASAGDAESEDLLGELDAAAEQLREESGLAPEADVDEAGTESAAELSRLAEDAEGIPGVQPVEDDAGALRLEGLTDGDDMDADGEPIASPVELDADEPAEGQTTAAESAAGPADDSGASTVSEPVAEAATKPAAKAAVSAMRGEDGMPIHLDHLLQGNRGGINHYWGGETHVSEAFHLDASASTDVIHDFNVGGEETDGDCLDIHELLLNEGLDARPNTDLATLGRYLRFLEQNGNTEILVGHEEDTDGDGSSDAFVADHRVVLENLDLTHDDKGKRLSDQDLIRYLIERHNLSVGKDAG